MATILTVLYTLGFLLSILCFIIACLQKPSTEQKLTSLVTFFAFLLWFSYWSNLFADNLAVSVLCNKLVYISTISVYFVLFIFYARYYRVHIPKWLYAFMSVFSILILVSTTTYDLHHLYYISYSWDNSGAVPIIRKEHGPLHSLYYVLLLCYLSLYFFIFLRQFVKKRTTNRLNEILMILMVFLPSVSYILEKILGNPSIELVPFGLLFTELILIYLIGKARISDINILAKEFIFNSIEDAFIVVDRKMFYKGSNKAAEELFPSLAEAIPNQHIQSISPELTRIFDDEFSSAKKSTKYFEKSNRVFQPSIRLMHDSNQTSYVLCLLDVTDQRKHYSLLQNYQRDLEHEVRIKTKALKQMQRKMLIGFAEIVENKNMITGGHVKRTSSYAYAIAIELRVTEHYVNTLTDAFIEGLQMVAPLHDIGKVSVPDSILDKPAKLTTEEFDIIKSHTTNGKILIERVLSEDEDQSYYEIAKNVAFYHHERWDGDGYPSRLKREEIPLEARIMAVADVFDALVSSRPYKKAFSMDTAFDIILEERGKHFDPVIVDAFISIRPIVEKVFKDVTN